MGLLSLLKSVIGLDGSGSDTRSGTGPGQRDVDVTVEHDPAAENEAAVKGTDDAETAASGAQAAAGDGNVATETTAGTETTVEETSADGEADSASEAETGDETTDADEPEIEGADEPVDTIKGIGPSYAERLNDIGIETVGDLAARDAADIAAETDLSEKRVGRWLDRARGED